MENHERELIRAMLKDLEGWERMPHDLLRTHMKGVIFRLKQMELADPVRFETKPGRLRMGGRTW